MSQAKDGDTVKVNYTGRMSNGSVFDSTEEREPLQFKLGEGQLIKGFEAAVTGMSPGETKTVELAPEEAYGPRREDMVVAIERSRIPEDMEPQVGQKLQLQTQAGQPIDATVTETSDAAVTVDANHPLAGRPLTFDIQLLEIA